jgi:hypothetical protein
MEGVPPAAKWLTLAGLIPFVALAALHVILPREALGLTSELMMGYALAILSFMGGCRWGFAAAGLGDGPTFVPLAISVIPPLFGWATLFLDTPARFVLMAGGFGGLLAADILLTRQGGAPAWWSALRIPVSLGVMLCLLVAAIAR